jgi:uncharacterized lipoprotein YddW (UPF0748 family)
VSNDFDPLRYLIQKAHAARLEVHFWFCVTYRDRHFRRWFADKFRAAVDIFSNLSGGASQGQGPAGWAQQGWMDLILPMDYQMQTLQVRANERQFLAALAKDDQYGTRCALLPLRRGFRSP